MINLISLSIPPGMEGQQLRKEKVLISAILSAHIQIILQIWVQR